MTGACHCGAVTFAVRTPPVKAVRCNCSYCVRRGWLTGYASPEDFELLTGAEALSSYQFGERTATHYFCSHCGIHTHFFGTWGGRSHYAFNIACLVGIDLESLPVEYIDGRSF